ncbi:MAG: ABC transporter ATP-binding protein [Acidimicrobiales bacterium]|nr:ABC transporter ATP-binding protein [Acidimicrobiales bacterium]
MTTIDEPPTRASAGIEQPTATAWEPVAVALRHRPPQTAIDPDTEHHWLRRLLPLVRVRRGVLVLGITTGVIALGVQVAVPAVARSGIDAVVADDRGRLHVLVAVLIGLGVARLIFGGVYRYALFALAWGIETDLRALVYDHLTRLSFSYYDRTQSGQVISRANSDIRSIQLLFAFGPLVLMSCLTFVAAFGYMLTIHVGLTLVSLSTLPGVFVLGVKLRNEAFPLSWITQARMAEVATIVDENVNGIRVVKSFAAEERQIRTLARAAQRLQWSSVEVMLSRARYNPLIEALPRVGTALVLLYGGWLAIDGAVTVGTLFAFAAYVIMLQAPFRMLGFLLLQSQRASASAQRIYEVLDAPPEIVDRPGAIDLIDPEGRVSFDDVHFSYRRAVVPSEDASPDNTIDNTIDDAADAGRVAVLDGFTMHVSPGERVAVVGRTGSGKSTITRLLARFYDADAGAVRIDDNDVRDLTLASLRHHVGIVTDEPFLFSASVHDNIAYARPDADRADVVAAATAAQADEFICRLDDGYDTVVGERGYTLSGGQRQRIAIARVLLANPRILVLDDATSAIDVRVEEQIHDALVALMQDRTTIIIAHRLSTIALANRVVLVEGGRVVATGTHAELLRTEPRYVAILADAGATDGDAPDALPDSPGQAG